MPRQLDLEYPEAAYHAMNRPTAGPTRPGERGILRRFGVGVIAKRDAENRLVAVQSQSAVPTRAKRRLEFEYDTMGRRVSKKTYTHTGSADVPQSQAEYVWDGWNLVAEFDGADALIRAYSWGTDLSGSIQGAGGVGGLIAVSVGGTMYFPAYDGNGNVVAYVSGGSGQVSAQHEYGPFGEVIRATSSISPSIPIRWSTKYTDLETDLVYYGHRYYNPSTGRWLSRDPIGEKGGLNLYGFVGNNPISKRDSLGLQFAPGDIVPPDWQVPPTSPPEIDCSGYSGLGGKTCKSCGGFGRDVADGYPGKAQTVCEGFKKLYTGTSMQGQAACVAQCLINAEKDMSKYPNCSDRNCSRLLAHIDCYASCRFIPIKGLPPGGAEVGWNDLLPSASLSPKCLLIGRDVLKTIFPEGPIP